MQVGDNWVPGDTPLVTGALYPVCVPVTYSAWLASKTLVVVPTGEAQLHVYASSANDEFEELPLVLVARIAAVTVAPLGYAVYVPTMSAVPAVRLMFESANPLVLAGAVITLIAVSGAPAETAIGIVNGTPFSTPMY